MTTRTERYQSMLNVEPRLLAILNTKGTVRKTELRRAVSAILRHYPTPAELALIKMTNRGELI